MRALTVGVFDCLHVGHVNLLERSKDNCDYLIVGVQTDEGSRSSKSSDPVTNLASRRKVLEAIVYVDETVPYTNVDELIVTMKGLDLFLVGEDQDHDGFKRAITYCEANGIKVQKLNRTPDVSSTEIKAESNEVGIR